MVNPTYTLVLVEPDDIDFYFLQMLHYACKIPIKGLFLAGSNRNIDQLSRKFGCPVEGILVCVSVLVLFFFQLEPQYCVFTDLYK
jgi:hypothetical protein